MKLYRPRLLQYFLVLIFSSMMSASINANEVTVKTEFMEVFTGAGRGYPVFFIVEKGEKFRLLKRKVDWLKIKSTQGPEGWVSYEDYAIAISMIKPNFRKQVLKSKWELGLSVGSFGSDGSYSVGVGYYVNPSLVIQAEAKKVVGTFSYSNIISAQLMMQAYRQFIVSPFMTAGFGFMENSPRQSLINASETQQNIFNIRGGINYIPYKRLNMRLSVGNYYLNTSKQNYLDVRLGIFALFG